MGELVLVSKINPDLGVISVRHIADKRDLRFRLIGNCQCDGCLFME